MPHPDHPRLVPLPTVVSRGEDGDHLAALGDGGWEEEREREGERDIRIVLKPFLH